MRAWTPHSANCDLVSGLRKEILTYHSFFSHQVMQSTNDAERYVQARFSAPCVPKLVSVIHPVTNNRTDIDVKTGLWRQYRNLGSYC